VRARVLAVYLLIFQGSLAAGSAVWGGLAQHTSVNLALIIAGGGTIATLLLRRYALLSEVVGDPTIWNHWRLPSILPALEPDADAGPVLVTVEYSVELDRRAEFVAAVHGIERVRRRDGAVQWGVYYDSEIAGRYLETFLVPSWAEHLRQHDRFTLGDRALEARINSTLRGESKASHFVYATTARHA
jgi:hypothetical protein